MTIPANDGYAGPYVLPIRRSANLHLTAQSAAIAPTIILTAPTPGLYRASFALAMAIGGGTGQINLEITSTVDGAVAVSQDSALVNVAAAGNVAQDGFVFEVASGNVTYAVVATGLTIGASRYSLRLVIEQLSVL